jgi:hypothetical protein
MGKVEPDLRTLTFCYAQFSLLRALQFNSHWIHTCVPGKQASQNSAPGDESATVPEEPELQGSGFFIWRKRTVQSMQNCARQLQACPPDVHFILAQSPCGGIHRTVHLLGSLMQEYEISLRH